MRVAIAAVFFCIAAGCASAPPAPEAPGGSAALIGTAADQKMFAGLWRGPLEAADPTLSRTIEFRLEPGAVLFYSGASTARKILWVRVAEGKIAGAMEPWFDPARKVNVYSTFDATVTEGVMHGIVRDKVGGDWKDVATFTATRVSD